MSYQGASWSEQMRSDSDEEDADSPSESPYKRLKTHDSPKVNNRNQAGPSARPVSASVSVSSGASSSREASGEDKSSYWSL